MAEGYTRHNLRRLFGRIGSQGGVMSEFRVPVHEDPRKKLLGEPPPGHSALDRKRTQAELAASTPIESFRVDWSKMSATGDRGAGSRHHPDSPLYQDGVPLEGDID